MARQSTLTKQHFDKISKTFARRVDLAKTNKTLDRVVATLDRTTALLANITEDFREFKEDLKNVPSILESHTNSLDKILKNTEFSKTETTALQNAVKRHEQWIMQIADKVGIKLESNL